MALPLAPSQALILTVAFVLHFGLTTCSLLKGSVSCLDCSSHFDFSGVRVGVQCKDVKRPVSAFTNSKGYFKVEVPSSSSPSSSRPFECLATILGGPEQLCSSKKSMVSKVVVNKQAGGSDGYTLSTPLTFMSSCPSVTGNPKGAGVGSSKTIELPQLPQLPPLPREWALAPEYFRFMPIIGIP